MALKWYSPLPKGSHCKSKTRLGWACAAETSHSRATTPEASLHLHGCHLTAASLGVIHTRGGRPVEVRHSIVFQSILKSVTSGQSDAWLSRCYKISSLCPTNRASFWNYNGELCEKGELNLMKNHRCSKKYNNDKYNAVESLVCSVNFSQLF